jgi:predicted Rossmann fold flavoprotein
MQKIAIIGAGASGIFAAINAKTEDNEVYLFDKNDKIGKKLFITGKGRCNITNAKIYQEFLDHIVVNKKFMYSSFTKFDNFALMDFIEKNGLPLEIQRGDRVFPKSEKSSDVIKFFERLLKEKEIILKLNEEIKTVIQVDEKFQVVSKKGIYEFDKLVIATGGISYPATGSTGDGYKFAKNLGHKLVDPVPSLVPIKVTDEDIAGLEGISLKNINLTVKTKDQDFEEFGDLLFAKKTITGPVVLTMSALINRLKVEEIYIDLKPALSFEKLDKRIVRDFTERPNLDISNNLKNLLLNAFIPIILKRAGIDMHKKCHQITKEEREKLVATIKKFYLSYDGLDKYTRAVVTSGGVDTDQINPSTMESKKIKNLYFIGEVLDIDALTGGYNLQLAFSTAFACAQALKE